MVLNEGKEMHGSKAGPDTSADDAWPFFVDFLKEKGSRITQARRIVFEHVFARHDHFRADDLAGELATGANHVSRNCLPDLGFNDRSRSGITKDGTSHQPQYHAD